MSPTLVRSMLSFVCMVHPWHDTAGVYFSAGHSFCTPLRLPRVPLVLPYPVSFTEQAHPTVRARLSDTDKQGGKGQLLRLRLKKLPHCATNLLPLHSHSPHNVLHSPSFNNCACTNSGYIHLYTRQFNFIGDLKMMPTLI